VHSVHSTSLNSTTGVVAVAAAAVAVIALLCCAALAMRLRRMRAAQKALLGDEQQDLVAHAAMIQQGFQALSEYVQDVAAQLHERMSVAEHRLDHSVSRRALVRYDAYGEMSGRQSTSIALLDDQRSGVVLSSIHHREQARLYAKELHDGTSELELSPEESEAVRLALEHGQDSSAPA